MPMKKGQKVPSACKVKMVKASDIAGLVFMTGDNRRKSEYGEALANLAQSPEGTVLEVEKVSARPSIASRARKMGIQVLFGELNGKLYVKAIGARTPEAFILEQLTESPKNMVELSAKMEARFPDAKLQLMLTQLSNSGQIALRDVPGKTGKAWAILNAAKLAVA